MSLFFFPVSGNNINISSIQQPDDNLDDIENTLIKLPVGVQLNGVFNLLLVAMTENVQTGFNHKGDVLAHVTGQ